MSLFSAIGSGIPSVFPQRPHPLNVPDNTNNAPVETNKFYTNMLLDARTLPIYPQPYSVWWTDVPDFYGLGISHCDQNQRVFGPQPNSNPAEYFYNPTGIMSLCLSADEFSQSKPSLATYSWGMMSVVAQLGCNSGRVQFPIVNGMGFVTGLYSGLRPIVSSQVGFKTYSTSTLLRRGLTKVRVTLTNDTVWLIYVSSPSGQNIEYAVRDGNHIFLNGNETNLLVQVAKLPNDKCEPVIDSAAGSYAVGIQLSGGVTRDYGTAVYRFNYALAGSSTGGGTLVYALPHHAASFTSSMNGKVTNFSLNSLVAGMMTMCVTSYLEMYEKLPRDVGFLPWAQWKPEGDDQFAIGNFSHANIQLLNEAAINETSQVDIPSATNLSSMYFSGKAIDKFALILLVVKYIIRDDAFARSILQRLQAAFDTFINNRQQTPLFYDTTWKGLVSQAGVNDSGADFGNTYYNDHHFHYGYFIHAAAIVGKVDKDFGGNWAETHKDWVNALVRDVANYGDDDAFPQSRSFDWFQGHSLAKGLFGSGDGKDEESSSEDYHCYYGMKLWASVIGDKAMEARSNLILAIERRAMQSYFLYESSNTIMPAQIIGNFVSGIKFENKIDHTTYFGRNPEYIQGIHMIPITPISSFIRRPSFVREEWEKCISGFVNNVNSGWLGILNLNLALYDPKASYAFFSQDNFNYRWLDDGLSRTWALAFSKGLQ